MAAKILIVAGSIRSGSLNTRLVGTLSRELALLDCSVTRISLEDYPLPIYNGDLEAEKGVPKNAQKLASQLDAHDGFFIVSPEYNGSLPPLLKNTIDWISRVNAVKGREVSPFRGKVAAIGACSPGAMGGMSMLYHLRDILVRLGAQVVSEQVSVGNGGSAFDDMDRIIDKRTAGFMAAACQSLADKAQRLKADR